MQDRATKQVIAIRTDLNMRKGKMVAQGAHASLGAVLEIMTDGKTGYSNEHAVALQVWLDTSFTKICVRVESESELMAIYNTAVEAGVPVKLITDNGKTEFHGIPTKTCLAVGPYWSDQIDLVTKNLKLL